MKAARFDIEDKIIKLLKKAESATPEEAELLRDKVHQLMARHAIDAAKLDEKRRASGHEGEQIVTRLAVSLTGSYRLPLRRLMFVVCNATDGIESYVMEYNGKHTDFYIVGYESDVEQMKLLLVSLEIQAAIAMRAWWISPETITRTKYYTGSQKWNERRGFIMGFANGVYKRMVIAKEEVQKEPGTELVLARDARVKKHVEDTVGKMYTTRSVVVDSTHQARQSGFIAGKNANTGGSQVGQRGRIQS